MLMDADKRQTNGTDEFVSIHSLVRRIGCTQKQIMEQAQIYACDVQHVKNKQGRFALSVPNHQVEELVYLIRAANKNLLQEDFNGKLHVILGDISYILLDKTMEHLCIKSVRWGRQGKLGNNLSNVKQTFKIDSETVIKLSREGVLPIFKYGTSVVARREDLEKLSDIDKTVVNDAKIENTAPIEVDSISAQALLGRVDEYLTRDELANLPLGQGSVDIWHFIHYTDIETRDGKTTIRALVQHLAKHQNTPAAKRYMKSEAFAILGFLEQQESSPVSAQKKSSKLPIKTDEEWLNKWTPVPIAGRYTGNGSSAESRAAYIYRKMHMGVIPGEKINGFLHCRIADVERCLQNEKEASAAETRTIETQTAVQEINKKNTIAPFLGKRKATAFAEKKEALTFSANIQNCVAMQYNAKRPMCYIKDFIRTNFAEVLVWEEGQFDPKNVQLKIIASHPNGYLISLYALPGDWIVCNRACDVITVIKNDHIEAFVDFNQE